MTPTDELPMVEKLKQAAQTAADQYGTALVFDEVLDAIVRAILLALRQPTEGMVDVGATYLKHGGQRYGSSETHASNIFTVMIDSILQEGDDHAKF